MSKKLNTENRMGLKMDKSPMVYVQLKGKFYPYTGAIDQNSFATFLNKVLFPLYGL
jgi:hypothetical protein